MSEEHRVKCSICKRTYRPIEAHINLVCNDCYRERPPDATGLIKEFLDDLEGVDQPDMEDATVESINQQIEDVYRKWEKKLKE